MKNCTDDRCSSHPEDDRPLGRGWTRRAFLRDAGSSMTAAMLGPSLFSMLGREALARGATGKKLVLLWLEGGPSQMETFDPKPGTENGGPLKALATGVPGWTFSEFLPQLHRRAKDLCVIRSMSTKEGNHSRARMLVKTGYVPNPTVAFPAIGAIVASELADPDLELPAFVQINGAPSPSGYLGMESAPFVIRDPTKKIENLDYAGGVDRERLSRRLDMLEVLEDEFRKKGGEEPVLANKTLRKRARRLMDTKLLAAFDLDQEKNATRDRFGRNAFGQGCLLARRLLEAGVCAVEVVLDGWDTHQDNLNRTKALCEKLDPAFGSLMDDLNKRGLDKDTLIVCMGEFGRTPKMSGDGRNHWPGNWCVAMSGAGLKGGTAFGETDENGTTITRDPVKVADLFATFSHALGFNPDKEQVVAKRPVTLVDKEGKILRGLFG